MIAPLTGVKVVEFEGIGPGPLAAQMLADLGAQVTVISRTVAGGLGERLAGQRANPMHRGKHVIPLDLKTPQGRQDALALVAAGDMLIEGHRPGVMERLGLGPQDCAALNPRLVYGRMTGWGQSGPLAQAAGHDLNYVALSGVLSLSSRPGQLPMVPPTVVGDATGALALALGLVSALWRSRASGTGCVVDSAIVDVVAMLGGIAHMVHASGQLGGPQPSPFHDSPFYDVYACSDGAGITLAALEPQFYALALHKLGLTEVDASAQYQSSTWPALKARLTALFATQPREHWCQLLEGSDACFAPVLSLDEAVDHPHNKARGTFLRSEDGGIRAVAAPRFLPL